MKTGIVAGGLVILSLLVGSWLLSSRQGPVGQSNPTMVPSQSPSTSPAINLPTKYIATVDWPPQTRVENQPFLCTEAGEENDRIGQTKVVIVNNNVYCATKITEGAAGSTYTQYAYSRSKGNQTEIFTFSLRFSQCGNYPEGEKTVCENERQAFNVDNFVDSYIGSNF